MLVQNKVVSKRSRESYMIARFPSKVITVGLGPEHSW